MNLLEEILARASQSAPAYDTTGADLNAPAGAKADLLKPAGISLLERLMGKKLTGGSASPFPDVPATPMGAAASAPPWAAQAGILAPGIGGLGNMDASTTRAPVGPTDPNYAEPVAPMSKTEREMQSMVDPSASTEPSVPMPRPGPAREADGTPSVEPAQDISSRGRSGPVQPQVLGALGPTSVGGPAGPSPLAGMPAAAPQPAPPPPQAPAGPQVADPSLWDKAGAFGNTVMNGLKNNSSTLLALGAGFAGAPNIGQGISRASQYAIPASQQDLKNRISTGSQSATYKALVDAGVPQQQALAAIGNPELQKRLLDAYIVDRKSEIKTIKSKDAFGNETEKLVSVNPYDNTVKDLSGGSQGGGDGVAAGGKSAGSFAPGVTADTFNHNAVGEDYIKQFSPEVQQAAKDYIAGRTTQTGRQQSMQMIKMAAQKYGGDIGMPADDASIGQRKQWSNSLGDVKNGVGLQAKGFQQGLEHAASLSDSLVKLGNTNGFGFEPAANWINSAKNLTGGQTNVKNEIQAKSQALAGEVGKLFSGQSGGGVHERAATQQNLGKTDQSPVAAAGGLSATIDLMEGGLRALEQRRDQLFPNGTAPKGSEFRGPEQEKLIAKIKDNIAILKGEKAASDQAAAKTSTGVTWRVVAP